jgi:hypothetical protein
MDNSRSYKINYGEIKNYYKDLNSNNIINLISQCKNNHELTQLLSNCTKHNIYLFKKNKENWTIKNSKQLIKECNSKKKNLLKNFSENINQISKDNTLVNSNLSNTLSEENSNVITNLNEIDKIINNLSKVDLKHFKLNVFEQTNYIAEYSN